MRIGYQGEAHSYSYRAVGELFPEDEPVGYPSFVASFDSLDDGSVDRLVMPVENSTTGSVLPVLDRLAGAEGRGPVSVRREHLVEIRHALLGVPGASLEGVRHVKSHPEALAQAEGTLNKLEIRPVPRHDTAGAVREVADDGNPEIAALGPPEAGPPHGLDVLRRDVMDRDHNTTRFFVLAKGATEVDPDDDKSTIMFVTAHRPGALALALTELGLRGANLTRIESRPSNEAWSYRFFVDLVHPPGPEGLVQVLEPQPATLAHLLVLGSYRSAR
ncbi:MAG: prephenate dehydratase domain-containing protein [Acidimicrobiia bacterium]|nr:prephenate dehydratase domain-containing protein [Acidimicrobiia bacterium]MDX2466437.1 prephenate dehydratase domain-containing protein [Acidimicrobiia bacterium]